MTTRKLSTPTLEIELDTSREAAPLKDQVYQGILQRISSKALRPGDRLPSSRQLAESLGVARVTVTSAYTRLSSEGYLESTVGRGSVVARPVSDRAVAWAGKKTSGEDKPVSATAGFAEKALDFKVQAQRPFAIVSPDYESLPENKWTQIVARLSKSPWLHNGYCEPGGYQPFREAVADYVRRTRGINCDADEVIVTSGIQQGLAISAKILFNPGDTVLVEDPGYPAHKDALRFFGMKIEGVPVANDGIDTAELSRHAGASGVLVTPCHQFPLGVLMSAPKRRELLTWAEENKAWIIEDDYDGELRYGGSPYPALAALDTNRSSVIYLGSFSKVIYPGFNLGYMVVPKRLSKYAEGAKMLFDRHASQVHQVILSEFISQGYYEAHVRRLKKLYADRRLAMIGEADRKLSSLGHLVMCNQGTHLAFLFDENIDDEGLKRMLKAEYGIEIRTISSCCENPSNLCGMILGFAGFTEDQIRTGIGTLAKGVLEYCSRRNRKNGW